MLVGKIALGVFLGNLAFGLLALLFLGIRGTDQQSSRELIDASAAYNAAAGSGARQPASTR
ncbi:MULTISPECIES: hypothetical protein [unclassified Sphingomonas]|uniref:hypothetical protein n=1 Tax=unclassified Sphingomonas TaxID=196159 RepID=UPI002269F8E3|nr:MULTISPECIES: hypothetical protein [unclassified Sphingomonas]